MSDLSKYIQNQKYNNYFSVPFWQEKTPKETLMYKYMQVNTMTYIAFWHIYLLMHFISEKYNYIQLWPQICSHLNIHVSMNFHK